MNRARFVSSVRVGGLLLAIALATSGAKLNASVIPLGPATTTVSYTTDAGLQTFSGSRAFNGSIPSDATILGAAPNIKTFNSVNTFGWRLMVPGAVYPGESVITNAFYKNNVNQDYFPGILEGSDLTLSVQGIHFDQPVSIDVNTMVLHTFWDADQVDQLPMPYQHVHGFRTATDPFRDLDLFIGALPFPADHYVLDQFDPVITGNGTDTLGYTITIPYELLRHIHEDHHGQTVPPGLPAPHGFLEPYHFHVEYAITPEPGTLCLLAGGALLAMRRGRSKR